VFPLIVFTKCKESLQEGRRLENISWRLWYREMMLESEVAALRRSAVEEGWSKEKEKGVWLADALPSLEKSSTPSPVIAPPAYEPSMSILPLPTGSCMTSFLTFISPFFLSLCAVIHSFACFQFCFKRHACDRACIGAQQPACCMPPCPSSWSLPYFHFSRFYFWGGHMAIYSIYVQLVSIWIIH
jgi:hypothetical protein